MHYPVTFPCVLIGNTESDWNDLGYGIQKSESLITIRLAIDCYDDTHYTAGTVSYTHLDVYKRQIMARPAGERFPNTAEADTISKLSNAIKKMETEVGLSDIISVFSDLQNPLPDQTHFPIFVFLKESVSDSEEKKSAFSTPFLSD